MNTTINVADFAAVVAGLLVVGGILKNAFPSFPNRFIPLVTWVLGVVAYLVITNGWNQPAQWLAAVITSATATGTYSAVKNTVQPSTPPPA
jgi:hypothetical protein